MKVNTVWGSFRLHSINHLDGAMCALALSPLIVPTINASPAIISIYAWSVADSGFNASILHTNGPSITPAAESDNGQ